jgi:hypothetical protein
MCFACLLAFAASLSVLAADPPKDDGKEAQRVSEKNFFDFQREWRVTTAHMEAGLARTYSFESKSGEQTVTGTVEIVDDGAPPPAPGALEGLGFFAETPDEAEQAAKAYLGLTPPAN